MLTIARKIKKAVALSDSWEVSSVNLNSSPQDSGVKNIHSYKGHILIPQFHYPPEEKTYKYSTCNIAVEQTHIYFLYVKNQNHVRDHVQL